MAANVHIQSAPCFGCAPRLSGLGGLGAAPPPGFDVPTVKEPSTVRAIAGVGLAANVGFAALTRYLWKNNHRNWAVFFGIGVAISAPMNAIGLITGKEIL